MVDAESKETRAAQLHAPIDDDQGEFDVLPPLRLTIKLNHGIKQGSDKRNKLLKRVNQLVGLASPVKTPVLFTLGGERSYGEGFVECDLDFVEVLLNYNFYFINYIKLEHGLYMSINQSGHDSGSNARFKEL